MCVVYGLLFDCSFFVAFAVCLLRSLVVDCCLVVDVCCVVFDVRCLLSVVRRLLFVVCCRLLIEVRFSWFVV